jgi:transcriptional regulator with XRE-family HTH domain
MGTVRRPKPRRLAEKLLQIRLSLGLSQNELIRRLDFEKELVQGTISTYELGKREPSLPLLLKYARLANVWVDVLIDDELDLPEKIPSSRTFEGVRRAQRAQRRKG